MLGYALRSHGRAEIEPDLLPGLPASVNADADRQIGQIVLNLLVNAQQAPDRQRRCTAHHRPDRAHPTSNTDRRCSPRVWLRARQRAQASVARCRTAC